MALSQKVKEIVNKDGHGFVSPHSHSPPLLQPPFNVWCQGMGCEDKELWSDRKAAHCYLPTFFRNTFGPNQCRVWVMKPDSRTDLHFGGYEVIKEQGSPGLGDKEAPGQSSKAQGSSVIDASCFLSRLTISPSFLKNPVIKGFSPTCGHVPWAFPQGFCFCFSSEC